MISCVNTIPKLYLVVFFFSINKILFTTLKNMELFHVFSMFLFFTHQRVVNNYRENTTISFSSLANMVHA